MSVEMIILNTGVVDLCRDDFEFVNRLAGESGLAKCLTEHANGGKDLA